MNGIYRCASARGTVARLEPVSVYPDTSPVLVLSGATLIVGQHYHLRLDPVSAPGPLPPVIPPAKEQADGV